jgi:hypothetical protein
MIYTHNQSICKLRGSGVELNRNQKYLLTLLVLSALTSTTLLAALVPSANAQSNSDLAAQYAPVLKFTAGEKFYPTTVDYVISSSAVKQRASDGSSTLVDANPTPSNLGTFSGDNYFLDNKLGTLDAIAGDYASKEAGLGYTVYVHVTSSAGSTVIQYWLLYVYNNGPMNDHQSDWEVVEIFLSSTGTPSQALYSQHSAGEMASWADVEKSGDHPIVYVAQGSHANYFRSYQGKLGIENDIVGSDGKTIQPTDLQLVVLGDDLYNLPADQNWLNFQGRWGYWGTDQEVALGMAGPLGPVFNQDGIRWAQPESYLAQTFSVDGTYFILALLVANFLLIFLVYTLVRAGWKVWGITKLLKKDGLLAHKIMKGQVAVGFLLGIIAIAVAIAGLFLPWYTITAASETGPLANQGGTTLMTINGVSGLQVNLFMGAGSADSSSGFVNLASAQMPFAIIIAAGVILLILDIIGLKNKNVLGKKLITGIFGLLLPVIFIIAFIMVLPSILTPFASAFAGGGAVPSSVSSLIDTIGANPLGGSSTAVFPVIGSTTVSWGLSIGAYMFIVAAVLRIVGGIIIRAAPNTKIEPKLPAAPSPTPLSPPPPPPPLN